MRTNPLTIDTHHHILPDFFWRETNDSHAPVGGLAPLQWSKEAMISFMDDAGIDVAVMAVNAKQRILESSELNDLERRAILGGNAARLFPRLHSVVGDRKSKETSS